MSAEGIEKNMKMIANLVDDMIEELHDAKHRIKNAYRYKSQYPEIAKREYEIAIQEMQHAEKDHASAVELIEKYTKEKGDPPEIMREVWEDKHNDYIEKHARIKCMIDAYAKT